MTYEDLHGDEAEYERGYQDGFDQFPPASNATVDYDIGYDDGINDSTMPEKRNQKITRKNGDDYNE
jgi:hypothetical protein